MRHSDQAPGRVRRVNVTVQLSNGTNLRSRYTTCPTWTDLDILRLLRLQLQSTASATSVGGEQEIMIIGNDLWHINWSQSKFGRKWLQMKRIAWKPCRQAEHPWKVTESLQLEVGKFDNYFLGFCDMLKRMCGLVIKPIPHIQCSQQHGFQVKTNVWHSD